VNGIMNETENVLKISDSKRDYFMDMKTKKCKAMLIYKDQNMTLNQINYINSSFLNSI
jgi:hypothetical protein